MPLESERSEFSCLRANQLKARSLSVVRNYLQKILSKEYLGGPPRAPGGGAGGGGGGVAPIRICRVFLLQMCRRCLNRILSGGVRAIQWN